MGFFLDDHICGIEIYLEVYLLAGVSEQDQMMIFWCEVQFEGMVAWGGC